MPRVLNKYRDVIPEDAVYIGRPSKWGNFYEIGKDGNREEVIAKYVKTILNAPYTIATIQEELVGKDLVCFCHPQPCHGDVLLEIANSPNKTSLVVFFKKGNRQAWEVYFRSNGVHLGVVYCEVDGEFVFGPELRGGFWSGIVLKELVEFLEEKKGSQDWG